MDEAMGQSLDRSAGPPSPAGSSASTSYSTASTCTPTAELLTDKVFRSVVPLDRLTEAEIEAWRKNKSDNKRKRKVLKYDVEEVIGHCVYRQKVYYEVTWVGYSREEATEEPIKNLISSLFLLRKYYEKKFGKLPGNKVAKTISGLEASIDTDLLFTKNGVEALMDQFSNTFEDFREKNLPALERKIGYDLDNAARCLTSMSYHPRAPDDKELRRLGVSIASMRVLISRRKAQLNSLKKWEREINCLEKCYVFIENNVDLETFPRDFTYCAETLIGPGVEVSDDPPLACTCDPCDTVSECCGKLSDYRMMYNTSKRLNCLERWPIYECNKNCKCPPECRNRVVQHGRTYELTVFKTNSCGWGVKAKKTIPKGAFVCEYIGEVITIEESDRRADHYPKSRDYFFKLDFFNDAVYCVDSTKNGNLSRFINHSCEPNLQAVGVWVNDLNPNLHKLALFATRNIKANEELSFDYVGDSRGKENMFLEKYPCLCGSKKCHRWLFVADN